MASDQGLYCLNSLHLIHVTPRHVKQEIQVHLNPCPAKPGYTLPLQTV